MPKENLLGEIGDGWQVAMTTLLHERGTLGFALSATLDVAVRKLVALAKERNVTDPILLDRIAREWVELQALKYTNYRSLTTLQKTGIPGPEGSASKLVWSENNQRLTKLALEILGSHAQLTDGGGYADGYWQYQQLRSRGNTIEAGTSEILRNIVAERVLGMPRSRGDGLLASRRSRTTSAARRARSSRRTRRRRWSSSRSSAGSGSCEATTSRFLDAAVLFEELGRVLYDGPFVLNEVAGQPGDDVWSIEIDGFVPHLEQVDRVLTPDMRGTRAQGETRRDRRRDARPRPAVARTASSRAEGDWADVRRRLLAALALEAVGIGSKAIELAIAYVKEREQFGKKIGTYQAISHSLVDALRRGRARRARSRTGPPGAVAEDDEWEIAWYEPIFFPNCSRSETYASASSIAFEPMPTASNASAASSRRSTSAQSPCAASTPFGDSLPRPSVSSTVASVSPCAFVLRMSGVRPGSPGRDAGRIRRSRSTARLAGDLAQGERAVVEHAAELLEEHRSVEKGEVAALPDPAELGELLHRRRRCRLEEGACLAAKVLLLGREREVHQRLLGRLSTRFRRAEGLDPRRTALLQYPSA